MREKSRVYSTVRGWGRTVNFWKKMHPVGYVGSLSKPKFPPRSSKNHCLHTVLTSLTKYLTSLNPSRRRQSNTLPAENRWETQPSAQTLRQRCRSRRPSKDLLMRNEMREPAPAAQFIYCVYYGRCSLPSGGERGEFSKGCKQQQPTSRETSGK